ncbi:hypothetical protein M513_11633 [Trichuris suis]|uniref:Uncharacterized protein n=1 Tax=Trichuris suis TaxID=68888 RepID=A0A085LR76_9BILA|nr:hypothetical protein M513_11633 [Trichuris suis]
MFKFRPHSSTSDSTMPIRLRMSISLAAFVFSLVLPDRPSEIHRWTVDLHFSGSLQEKRSQLVVVNYLVPARRSVIGLPLGERGCDS